MVMARKAGRLQIRSRCIECCPVRAWLVAQPRMGRGKDGTPRRPVHSAGPHGARIVPDACCQYRAAVSGASAHCHATACRCEVSRAASACPSFCWACARPNSDQPLSG